MRSRIAVVVCVGTRGVASLSNGSRPGPAWANAAPLASDITPMNAAIDREARRICSLSAQPAKRCCSSTVALPVDGDERERLSQQPAHVRQR